MPFPVNSRITVTGVNPNAYNGTYIVTGAGNNGAPTYNSTTGVLNVPTYTLAGLGGINLTSLSATSPLLYNNTTGVFSIQQSSGSQAGYLSSADWTTFNSKQSALTNPVTGTGTTNYLPKFTGTSAIGNSLIYDNGTQVGIGTNSILSGATLEVYNATQGNLFISSSGTNDSCLRFFSGGNELVTLRSTGTGALRIETGTGSPVERLRITSTGLVGIGTNNPLALLDVCLLSSGARRLLVNYADSIVTVKSSNDSSNGENLRLVGDNIIFNSGSSGNGSERMRITSGGNVGIGTSSPSRLLTVVSSSDGITAGISGATYGIRFDNGGSFSSGMSTIHGVDSTLTGSYQPIMINGSEVRFGTSATERMRIDSTRVLIGQTSASISTNGWNLQADGGGHASFSISNNEAFIYNNRNTGTTYEIDFRTNSIERGKISVTDSGVSYVTTSDYRVKEDFKEINGLEKVSAIKVYDFKFKDMDLRTDGVIAHELQEILPYAVTGEKDGKKFQGVDYSKIVPVLVKAIQELSAKVSALDNKS